MKLKKHLYDNKWFYSMLLVGIIVLAVLVSLRLFYRDPTAPGQGYSPRAATKVVSDYLVLAEYIYEKPPFEAYSDLQYIEEGDRWAGRYTGPSAWGEDSTIIWVLYEQEDAVQVVVGYANP